MSAPAKRVRLLIPHVLFDNGDFRILARAAQSEQFKALTGAQIQLLFQLSLEDPGWTVDPFDPPFSWEDLIALTKGGFIVPEWDEEIQS